MNSTNRHDDDGRGQDRNRGCPSTNHDELDIESSHKLEEITAPPLQLSDVRSNGEERSISSYSASTAALCMCTLTHAYLLLSIFPYAGYMVMYLIPSVNEENAGTYSGLVASSFMAGRTLSAYHWGKMADLYGRKVVLNASLILSGIFSILFGTAQTFSQAMIWRLCLGASNGIVSTVKTAVTELAHGNDELEMRAMGLVVGMRSWGFLISPAVGGFLADPKTQYPNLRMVVRFGHLLSRFPFLLPNLMGAIFCVTTAVAVMIFVEETLPKEKRRSLAFFFPDIYGFVQKKCKGCKLRVPSGEKLPYESTNEESARLLPEHFPPHQEENAIKKLNHSRKKGSLENGRTSMLDSCGGARGHVATISSLWQRNTTRRHLVLYWMFSFVVGCLDEAFPLFCISKEGGLGLSEASIGKILSGAGLLFTLFQYFAFATIVNRFGLYPSLTIGSLMGVPPVFLIPLSLLLNKGVLQGDMSFVTFFFLCILMASCKVFTCLFFTSIAIATNKTVPTYQRATMNGLAVLGCSISKGLGPTFAGVLVAFSMSSGVVPAYAGSVLIFSVISCFGFVIVCRLAGLSDKNCEATVCITESKHANVHSHQNAVKN